MKEEYCCLKELQPGDHLNETQLLAINELKTEIRKFHEQNETTLDIDDCYLYANLAEAGITEEDSTLVDWLYQAILYNALDCYVEEAYEDYPLAFRYLKDMIPEFDASELYNLYWFYSETIKDDELAFRCVLAGTKAYPTGLCGGFALVNTLATIDSCRLAAGLCYMEGKGTKKDLPAALSLFLAYHTDHLVQKHCTDELTETTLSELFHLLKNDADSGLDYPGLFFSLAIMYREGIGTAIDYEQYCVCKDKAIANQTADSEYTERALRYFDAVINCDTAGNPFCQIKSADANDFTPGDVVRLGKFNHRDILWYVVKVNKKRVLLLATDCLDSSYIANEKFNYSTNECYENSAVREYAKAMLDKIDVSDEGDLWMSLCPDKYGDYVFLPSRNLFYGLNEETLQKILPAGATRQAQINGYDGEGVEINECTGSASWWTSTDACDQKMIVFNGYGYFEPEMIYSDYIGIRPAVWLKKSDEARL